MRVDAFLRTRVARRVLWLFFVCALLPLGALAFVGYRQVSSQLTDQSRKRVHQMSKASGMEILQRLNFLEMQLRAAAQAPELATHFTSLALARPSGVKVLKGHAIALPAPNDTTIAQLRSGRAAVVVQQGAAAPHVLMAVALDPKALDRGVLWGQADLTYLWGTVLATLPAGTPMCLFQASARPMICTGPSPQQAVLPSASDTAQSAVFDWSGEGERYVGARWTVFLQFAYGTPAWTVVVGESQATVLAPTTKFRHLFVPTLLLALWVVLLLSNVQIRRSLEPLEKLSEGTKRLAGHHFDQPVVVHSKDEFEDLAQSFNRMSQELALHFGTLSAMNEIDRAALSQLDGRRIVNTVLAHVPRALPCDAVSIALTQRGRGNPPWQLATADRAGAVQDVREVRPTPAQVRELEEQTEFLVKPAVDDGDGCFRAAAVDGQRVASYLVLPLFLKQQLSGFVALGYAGVPTLEPDEVVRARQLADQVAVALSNNRLLEELDAMNWGALETLARTIDAKSHWTAGHSQRVTALAVQIGREMGLGESELTTLQRGGLMHDLGKIGVPATILDKPGVLTKEEMEIMRSHVTIGARLLEPMEAFASAVPIALYHHEQWDGSGYPEGLAGEAIPFFARLLTIPDVYDALRSDRPYRPGWAFPDTVAHIRTHRGKLFDPAVVDALLALVQRGEVTEQSQETADPQFAAPLEASSL